MKGILCSTKAITNEEFKHELEKKKWLYFMIIVSGLLLLLISAFSAMNKISLTENMQDVISGTGFGLMIVGGLFIVKIQYILRDEERLKAERLNNSDERNVEINNRSFRCAAWILIISLYITALIGSVLIDERILSFFLLNIIILLVGYLLSYTYFKHKL